MTGPDWATSEHTAAGPPPPPSRRTLWPLLLGALLAVVLLVATVAGVYLWRERDGIVDARVPWQPQNQTFLQASMKLPPVPGWRLPVNDLGLPTGARIATDPMPIHSHPLIGNVEARAFFLASSSQGASTSWWLAGVNVDVGQRLFPPVQLSTGSKPHCFLNGPDALLCVTSGPETRTAWVIDSHTGAVTYFGPTDLQRRPSDLWVEQIGMYAVAHSENVGAYGVGPMAETTWFVPGTGDTRPRDQDTPDIPPPTFAIQPANGPNSFGVVTFSLKDGRVIKPDIPEGAEQQDTFLYPGGFAAAIASSRFEREIQFFDESGRRTTQTSIEGFFPSGEAFFDLPVVGTHSKESWSTFTPDGGLVLDTAEAPTRLMGSRLIVGASDFSTRGWAQYDIHTGTKGQRCTNLDMDFDYIGYDGTSIAVTSDGNQTVGLDTEATDFNTCERLWTISSPPGSFRNVWRINTTLVQLSDDGTELMSLVAPS